MDEYVIRTRRSLQRVLELVNLDNFLNDDQYTVHTEFKDKLLGSPKGWYQTWLLWKTNNPNLYKNGSRVCLSNQLSKLHHDPASFQEYDDKIEKQLAEGLVEKAPAAIAGKDFYIPYKPVIE